MGALTKFGPWEAQRGRSGEGDDSELLVRQGISSIAAAVVPQVSHVNHKDMVLNVPRGDLAELFPRAFLAQSMFVALEHMQVNFVTVPRTRLSNSART